MTKELDRIWEGALSISVLWRRKDNIRRGYKKQYFYHWTWNLYHPEDFIIKGDGMVIHHKDFNPLNDRIDNLQKMTKAEHTRLHNLHRTDKTRKKSSESKKGKKNPMYGRRGINSPSFGTHPSVETLKKYSEATKGNKNPRARYCMIEYNIFSTLKEASICLNISKCTIWKRLKANKSGYFYIT